ncbi:MAG: phosphoethanolamine transferase CptA, partial [Rhodothermia bacterium]|nr:phosphoethanolamine transferase CptA [Rhodothermia bacterium]
MSLATSGLLALPLVALALATVVLRVNGLIDAVAFFVAWLWVTAEQSNYGDISWFGVSCYVLMSLCCGVLGALVYRVINWPLIATGIASIFWSALMVIPVFHLAYAGSFRTRVDRDVINAVLQSDIAEGASFLWTFVPGHVLGLVTMTFVVVSCALHLQDRSPKVSLSSGSSIGFVAVSGLLIAQMGEVYPRVARETIAVISEYRNELKDYRQLLHERNLALKPVEAVKDGFGETYILVIGESLAANHMSLYGYPRSTTPNLRRLEAAGSLI